MNFQRAFTALAHLNIRRTGGRVLEFQHPLMDGLHIQQQRLGAPIRRNHGLVHAHQRPNDPLTKIRQQVLPAQAGGIHCRLQQRLHFRIRVQGHRQVGFSVKPGTGNHIAPGIRTEKFIQVSFEVGNDDTMHGTSSRSVRLILTENKAKAIPENGPLSGPETPLGKARPGGGDNTVPETVTFFPGRSPIAAVRRTQCAVATPRRSPTQWRARYPRPW